MEREREGERELEGVLGRDRGADRCILYPGSCELRCGYATAGMLLKPTNSAREYK
jgi:hypothetical protein